MLVTLREYIPAVFRELWGLVIGVVAAVIGAIALSVAGITVTWWGWLLIGLICLGPAQFLAYHRLRQRGTDNATQASTSITNNYYTVITGGSALPPALPPHLEQGSSEDG